MRQSSLQGRHCIGIVMFFLSSAFLATVVTGVSPAAAATQTKCTSSSGSSWDQAQTGSCRFTVLADFGGAAVRDNNTGLVWEQSPSTAVMYWAAAEAACLNRTVANQRGWRLPAAAELASLIDPTVSSPGPTVPVGHPFSNIQSGHYWSMSTRADSPSVVWTSDFFIGLMGTDDKTLTRYVWCVRGPMQESVY